MKHSWFVCQICGPMVICGKCGNNCCNGGSGELADGSRCDACPSAYALQDQGPPPLWLILSWPLQTFNNVKHHLRRMFMDMRVDFLLRRREKAAKIKSFRI